MPTPRRDFLKLVAGSAAASSVLGSSGAVYAALERGQSPAPAAKGGTPGTMTPEERRRLIARAVFGRKDVASGMGGLVICAHPLATRAGTDILRAGGNAADAALAASVTQTVVEPHMTGITGVLSLLYYEAATGKLHYVNGGMNAPMACESIIV